MTLIKVCGITSLDDAKCCVDLGVDLIGFNFFPDSKRYIPPATATTLAKEIAGKITTVGLFVNASREFIAQTVSEVGLDVIQLHGDEPVELCQGWNSVSVMKAFRIDDRLVGDRARAVPEVAPYLGSIKWLLADKFSASAFGGTGETLSLSSLWQAIPESERGRLFMAGGLTPENVREVVEVVRPLGVDVASGVEGEIAGKKCREKIARFVGAVRGTG